MKRIVVIVLFTFLLLSFSGCIDSTNNGTPPTHIYKQISTITIDVNNQLNYTEVSAINYSYAKMKLDELNYSSEESHGGSGFYAWKLHLYIALLANTPEGVNETSFHGEFRPDERTPEMDEENETSLAVAFLKDRMKEIAKAVNVTVTDELLKSAQVRVIYAT